MRSARRLFPLALACLAALGIGAGPANAGVPDVHEVVRGDSLWEIGQKYGCKVSQLREANDMAEGDALVVGRKLSLTPCNGRHGARRHVVASGETLSGIALHHGTTVEELRRLNAIEGSLIRVGQELALPGPARRQVRVVPGQSVGRPDRGKLRDPSRLPKSSAYYRRRTERTYASSHLIDHTLNVLEEVRRQHPGVHRLAIGDLSSKRGGSLSGHASHQSGRDIDLGFYYRKQPAGYPQEFVVASKKTLDLAATWDMVESFAATSGSAGGVSKIFLDYEVQGWLYDHARKRGVPKRRLKDVFQYPDGKFAKHGIVRHEPNHADHLHVRFGCAPRDENCR